MYHTVIVFLLMFCTTPADTIRTDAESDMDVSAESESHERRGQRCDVSIRSWSFGWSSKSWNANLEQAKVSDLHNEVRRLLTAEHGRDPGPSLASRYRVDINGRDIRSTGLSSTELNDALLSRLGLECGMQIRLHLPGLGGVAHGTPVKNENLDWIVKLQIEKDDGFYVCTGNAFDSFNKNKILTAAHCVRPARAIRSIVIFPADGGNAKFASGFYVHPEFYPDKTYREQGKDVAVIEYAGDNICGGGCQKHVYKVEKPSDFIWDGAPITLAGFGDTHNSSAGLGLHSGSFNVGFCQPRPYSACAQTGIESRTASCGGDSGGPWFREVCSSSQGLHECKFAVVGIHMGGMHCRQANGMENPFLANAVSDFVLLAETAEFWTGTLYRNMTARWPLPPVGLSTRDNHGKGKGKGVSVGVDEDFNKSGST